MSDKSTTNPAEAVNPDSAAADQIEFESDDVCGDEL